MFDLLAVLVLTAGILLFATGRAALGRTAGGHASEPDRESWVLRTERHDAQTKWGIGLVITGVVVAIFSTIRQTAWQRPR